VIAQLVAAATLAVSPAVQTKAQYSFSPFASGFDQPVYVAATSSAPDRVYVVEQPGRIVAVQGNQRTTFLDIRDKVRSGGEQGLLSMAFSPGYAQNRRFYVDYTDLNGDTRVVEYRSDGTKALPSSARELLFVKQPYANHNGGQLQFDKRGFLYVGMGDGGSGGDPQNRAQNLSERLGKLLRINPLRSGAWHAVGYGLRNPWRFSFDRANGNLWIGDVGQGAWEEIDFRPASQVGKLANYGWPKYEGRAVYDSARPFLTTGPLVTPTWVYGHNAGACSVTGGYVYRGGAVKSAVGRYFFGDYCNGRIWSFKVGSGRKSPARLEPFNVENLSSFGEDARGELYATSLNGTVYKLGG
jgi:glucose/arabinose dehydrogenase